MANDKSKNADYTGSYDVEFDEVGMIYQNGSGPDKLLFIAHSFKDEVKAMTNLNLALIEMYEPEQLELFQKLWQSRFIRSLSNIPLRICQHSLCYQMMKNNRPVKADYTVYLQGVRLRGIAEDLLLAFCEEHYNMLENEYLLNARWVKKFETK